MSAPDHISKKQFFPVIRAEDVANHPTSREVSLEEFQELAGQGKQYMDRIANKPATGTSALDTKMPELQEDAWNRTREPWGGATYNTNTGKNWTGRAKNSYIITARKPGQDPISIPADADRDKFNEAMSSAKDTFPQVTRSHMHLGVFHDADKGTIDIDPVMVVNSRRKVEQIGAYTRATGGAYHPRSGNGYYPPHVKE